MSAFLFSNIETKFNQKPKTFVNLKSVCVSAFEFLSVCVYICVCVSVCVCGWVNRFKAVNHLKASYKLTCACNRIYWLCKFIASFDIMAQKIRINSVFLQTINLTTLITFHCNFFETKTVDCLI